MANPYVDPGPWTKFLWKGVDMAASFAVNMATLIVGTAAFTWWRKRLERAIDKKIDWKYSLAVRKAHLAELQEEWRSFIAVTENINTANAARKWLSEFMFWLDKSQLKNYNGAFVKKWSEPDRFSQMVVPGVPLPDSYYPEVGKEFHQDVKCTISFPDPDDSKFPWPDK